MTEDQIERNAERQMNKVWVLVGGWDYEGTEVIGVFNSAKECEDMADKLDKDRYDYYDWNQFVIGEVEQLEG